MTGFCHICKVAYANSHVCPPRRMKTHGTTIDGRPYRVNEDALEELTLLDYYHNHHEDKDMLNDFSESKVTIKKDELLTAVRKNREIHEKEYLAAREGYRETVIKRLETSLAGVRAGGSFDLTEFHALAAKPMNHTKDYDRVIRMMEMSTADEVTVSESQFSCYVLDEWNWKAAFTTTNSTYSKSR